MDQDYPKKLILLVSIYNQQRGIYSEELDEIGYSVVGAGSGHSAATELKVANGSIDLIIMGSRDRIPEVDMLENAITSMEKIPPIIIHSAHYDPEGLYQNSPVKPYITRYVPKSGNPAPLLNAVEKTIGLPQQ